VPHKPFTEILHAVAFPKGDTSVGLAVGDRGTILRTPDGGKTWTLVPSGFVGKLKGVCFTDPSTAIAVGEGGWILKSIDGGMNWNRRPSGTTKNLNAVSFCSAGTGVIVGDSGMILRSYSSGEFWGQMFTTPVTRTEYFRGVSFPDSLHAYICGEATVYNSTDGGFTWEATKGGSESPGESISFADSIHGGFVHTDRFGVGYVQVTSNGGVSFDSIYPPYSTKGGDHSLSGIFFTDRQHATVVGVLGYIAHSTNGGKTWTEQQSNTLNNLNAVAFGSVKAGTAVGYRGNIMRITTNEKLAAPTPTAMGSPKAILDPCYPNPATSTINISFSLPASGSASIKLYTIDGKEITMAADGFMEAGEHRTRLDLTSLSSGSYVLSLSFGGAIVSQTVHLVR
ncbi:MAG: YCF48-related protein, partial [Bacteroidota bacterium]|nr:YCF48-related protein [Bacteroidota bacterium]